MVKNSKENHSKGTQNQRSYALSAIASICNQNITTDRKMDKSLAKKLLKYVLSEESVLDIESILVAGLIYYSAETEFDLPQKFTHRAIQLINAKAGFQIGGRTLSISSYILISDRDPRCT